VKPLIEDAIAFHHIAHCLQVSVLEVNLQSDNQVLAAPIAEQRRH
jgi:hypothetical protein